MTVDLFPHQERGAAFLAAEGGTKGLFFGMGTGKTITALEAFHRSSANQLLVIAPPIALPMWLRELQDHLRVYDNLSTILTTSKTPIKPGHRMLVTSYEIARKRQAELNVWCDRGCTALVCDESHALKSAAAKRTRAVLGAGGLAGFCHYVWLLTGTPVTRWNDDVYPFLCRADMPGLRKRCGGNTLTRYKLRYTIQQKRQFSPRSRPVDVVVGNRNTTELGEWIYGEGLALRVDLQEVFDAMPPLTTNRYAIKLDADAKLKAALKQMEKSSLQDIRKRLEAKEPALASVRRDLGLAMVKGAVAEIKERVESGQNVLVGAWHTAVIDALHEGLSGYSRGVIDGRTTGKDRQTCEQEWNAGNVQVLICQIAAAGVSLNLQHGGSQIVVVEEDWSPSIMDQFYARLWRYGQEKHVHVDVLTSDNRLAKALGAISSTKRREHGKFNDVGRQHTQETKEIIDV